MFITIVTPTIRPAGLQRVYESLKRQTYKDFEWLVEINTSGKTDFNQSMNKMIGRAKGDIIVSVQDYIEIPDNALEYIASLPPAFYTFPIGKIDHDGDTPRYDWRKSRQGEINWNEWEICFGAAPKEWLIKLGGFDERLDEAWGFDNVSVGYRAHQAGYPMLCNNSIEALALDHDAFMSHPLKDRRNPDLFNQRIRDYNHGEVIKDVQKYVV